MIFGEYDREMDIAVNRREAREEERQYFLELLNQNLTKEEIKERLLQFGVAQVRTAQPCG